MSAVRATREHADRPGTTMRVTAPKAPLMATLVAALILGVALVGVARGDRVFYQGGLWLETSAEVQRLSLLRVLGSWRAIAEEGEGAPLPHRQAMFARLHRCLDGAHTTEELLQRITGYSFAHPERVYYSLSDFVGEAVRDLCARRALDPPGPAH